MNSDKKRIDWIDWAKAIAIFLMVIGHCWNTPKWLIYFICSFHMPVFFIVSGYLYKPRDIVRSLASFVMPVLFFTIITYFYRFFLLENCSFQEYYHKTAIWGYSASTGMNCFAGIWFIQVLLTIRLLLGDIPGLDFIKKYYKAIAVIIVFVVGIISIYQDHYDGLFVLYAIPSFPFVAVGIYLKEKNWSPQQLKWKYVIPMAFLFIVLSQVNKGYSIYGCHFGYSYFIFFAVALMGCFSLFKICSVSGCNDFIKMSSVGTLLILPLHPWMYWSLTNLIPGKLYDLGYIIIPVILMIVYYPIIKIVYKYCPILIGKVSRKKQ